MQQQVNEQTLKALIGKDIYAVKNDGSVVYGRLVRLHGNMLYLETSGADKARFGPIIPLVLFNLLAIGTLGAWGGGGCGFGGCGPYPGYGPYGVGPGGFPGSGPYPGGPCTPYGCGGKGGYYRQG